MKHGKVSSLLLIAGVMALGYVPSGLAAGYKEVSVNGGGTISGKLTFEGTLPEDAVEKIAINKNPEVCDIDGTGYREVVWVDVKEGALRGAFVFIDKIKEGKPWSEPEDGSYVILQKGCRFRPWAQVIRPGPIIIRNGDQEVLHNINTREMIGVEKGRVVKRTLFNFGQPETGDIQKKLKPRRSAFIAMNCEAHNFMFGFMMAPKHPYAVVVNEDGSYAIDNVPPGTYTVKAWHPRFGVKKTELTVPENGTAEANFSFSMEAGK